MVRAVADTNTLVSALINFKPGGVSYDLLRFAEQRSFELITSTYIMEELVATLRKPRLEKYIEFEDDIETYRQIVEDTATHIITTWPDIAVVSDPKDNAILACAVAAHAEYLISRDKHLRVIGEYEGVKIITPEDFLALLRGAGEALS